MKEFLTKTSKEVTLFKKVLTTRMKGCHSQLRVKLRLMLGTITPIFLFSVKQDINPGDNQLEIGTNSKQVITLLEVSVKIKPETSK